MIIKDCPWRPKDCPRFIEDQRFWMNSNKVRSQKLQHFEKVKFLWRKCTFSRCCNFWDPILFEFFQNLWSLKFISLMVSLNLKKPFLSSSFPAQALSQWEFKTKRTLSNSSHKTFLNQSELCFWAGKEADWKGFFEF